MVPMNEFLFKHYTVVYDSVHRVVNLWAYTASSLSLKRAFHYLMYSPIAAIQRMETVTEIKDAIFRHSITDQITPTLHPMITLTRIVVMLANVHWVSFMGKANP